MESNIPESRLNRLWTMYYKVRPYSKEEEAKLEYDGEYDPELADRSGAYIAQSELIKLGLLDPHAEWPAERKDKND